MVGSGDDLVGNEGDFIGDGDDLMGSDELIDGDELIGSDDLICGDKLIDSDDSGDNNDLGGSGTDADMPGSPDTFVGDNFTDVYFEDD